MIKFNDESKELTVVSTPHGWRIKENVYVETDRGHIVVEDGFLTDFGSIPAAFRVYVSNDDYRVRNPALLHDWIYAHRGKMIYNQGRRYRVIKLNRKEADRFFREALRYYGVGNIKSWLMWAAVRVGGGNYWNK